MAFQASAHSEQGFKRMYASIAVWVCTGATAMAFAQARKLSRATPLPPMSSRRKTVFTALYVVVGVALMASFFLFYRR